MFKLLPTSVHGVLDYIAAVTLFGLPRLLGWPDTVTSLLTIMAFALLFYSLMTRYELAIFRLLPMGAHLGLDILSGVLLIGAAFLFWNEGTNVFAGLLGLGIFEVVAALISRPFSPVEQTSEQGSSPIG
jgi:hypothetical protein